MNNQGTEDKEIKCSGDREDKCNEEIEEADDTNPDKTAAKERNEERQKEREEQKKRMNQYVVAIMQVLIGVLILPVVYGLVELLARGIRIESSLPVYVLLIVAVMTDALFVWLLCRYDGFKHVAIKLAAVFVAWVISVYSLIDYAKPMQTWVVPIMTNFVYIGPVLATGTAVYMLYLAIQYTHHVPQVATQ